MYNVALTGKIKVLILAMKKDELLTPDEVAKILKVHSETVRRWLREGTLSGIKLGKSLRWRIKREELDRYIAQQGRTEN